MADIEKMVKYSSGKVGAFERAKGRINLSMSKVFGERSKDIEQLVSRIKISSAKDDFSSDIKMVIEKISKSPIWDKDNLSKLDEKSLKHLDGLAKSINALIAKMAVVKGEKNSLNANYADLQTAFVDYLKVVEDYSSRLNDIIAVNNASIEKQKSALGIETADKKNLESIVSAIAYMGREVNKNADGTYVCGEAIDGRGFEYVDANGKTQYIAISKDATQVIIDSYLNLGGISTEKEEKELAEQQDALRQMRENQNEVGIYAPSPSEIQAQERLVERAQKALNEKKSQVLTPNGLFKYFVEQELIGSTSRRGLSKLDLINARDKFSTEAPLWLNFEMERNPKLFLDDMALMASSALTIFRMQDAGEKAPVAYGDSVKSLFASGIVNSNRLDRLEADIVGLQASAQDLSNQNNQSFLDLLDRYEMLAGVMEDYTKFSDNPHMAPMATEAMARVDALKGFVQLTTNLSGEIEAGNMPNAPESVKNNSINLISSIMSKVSFENGKLTLTQDLTNEAGEVWLSKDNFEAGIIFENENENTIDEPENASEKNAVKDIADNAKENLEQQDMNSEEEMALRASGYGAEFLDGDTFVDAIGGYQDLYSTILLVQEGNNLVASIYNDCKASGLSVDEYFNKLLDDGYEKDVNQSLLGLTTYGALKTVCGNYNHNPNDLEGSINTFNKDESIKSIHEKSQLAFYYMDCVISELKKDEKQYDEYLNADDDTKDKIFAEKYKEIKKSIKIPTEKDLKEAEDKYKNAYQSDKIKGILNELEGREVPQGAIDLISALAKQCGLTIKEENHKEKGEEIEANKASGAIKKKFGDLYPRSPSAKAIAKKLQPFNIAAGIKFFNQLLDAFQKINVTIGGEEENKIIDAIENPFAGVGKNGFEKPSDEKDVVKGDDAIQVEVQNGDANTEKTSDNGVLEDGASADGNKVVDQGQTQVANLFEGRTDDQVRSRLAMMAVGMSVNSILDELNFPEDVVVDNVRQAMDYMTMQELPQPIVNIKINGRTSAVILSDAMQYVFLNEFASGNKDANEVGESINQIASQLGDNEAIVSVVKSMVPLMGAITPGEIIHVVKQTAEVQSPEPGEPISIDLGSKLTVEDIAQFRSLKSMSQVRELLKQSEMYDQNVINDIFGAGNQLRDDGKLKDPQEGELTID